MLPLPRIKHFAKLYFCEVFNALYDNSVVVFSVSFGPVPGVIFTSFKLAINSGLFRINASTVRRVTYRS